MHIIRTYKRTAVFNGNIATKKEGNSNQLPLPSFYAKFATPKTNPKQRKSLSFSEMSSYLGLSETR